MDSELRPKVGVGVLVLKDGKAYLQTGAGIVADSDPAREYDESMNKAKAMLAALARATRKEDSEEAET